MLLRLALWCAVATVTLGAPRSTHAAGATHPRIVEALAEYDNFAYAAAEQQLNALLADPNAAPVDRAYAHAYLALVRSTLGDRATALEHFARAVALDASVALPLETSPAVLRLLEDARQAWQRAQGTRAVTAPASASSVGVSEGAVAGADARGRGSHLRRSALIGGGVLVLAGVVAGGLAWRTDRAVGAEKWADRASTLRHRAVIEGVVAGVLALSGSAVVGVAWLVAPLAADHGVAVTTGFRLDVGLAGLVWSLAF